MACFLADMLNNMVFKRFACGQPGKAAGLARVAQFSCVGAYSLPEVKLFSPTVRTGG
jgi:hypothetical protein